MLLMTKKVGRISFSKVAYNVFRLDAGRELEVQKLSISRMLNRITKAEYSTNALLAFKPMLADVLFSGIDFNF